jgi:formate hydrogenlyase subunit 4
MELFRMTQFSKTLLETHASFIAALLLAPMVPGIINRTKAFFAGRQGPPLLQLYYDLLKLLRKGIIYSSTTGWVFRTAPVVTLTASIGVLMLLPATGAAPALISFPGDLILFAYLFGVARFFTVTAALDTGSSLEGMGASREVQFAALSEPAFLISLAALASLSHKISLNGIFSFLAVNSFSHLPVLLLVMTTILLVLLTENCRIPVDDPNTHLELTMIHEVMILDNSGPDLAYILYGSALKLWAFGTVLISIALPFKTGNYFCDSAAFLGGIFLLAVLVGMVESAMASFRLDKVPKMLITAAALSIIALILTLR